MAKIISIQKKAEDLFSLRLEKVGESDCDPSGLEVLDTNDTTTFAFFLNKSETENLARASLQALSHPVKPLR